MGEAKRVLAYGAPLLLTEGQYRALQPYMEGLRITDLDPDIEADPSPALHVAIDGIPNDEERTT